MPSLLDILLSDEAAKAICWTLVHSLWEGAIAALAAGAIILGTSKQPAALRYILLTATVAFFVIVSCATFFYELKPHEQTATPIENIPASIAATEIPHANTPLVTPTSNAFIFQTALQRATDLLNANAILVTFIWLGCLLAQLLRLSGGLYQLHRLRHQNTIPATTYWATRLDALAQQLGIRRQIPLGQSSSVKTPSAFGFLKPAILVPLGFFAQLPDHQVETILLHELAHIRRNDYLANIVLHLTEAVFFFNPGIRWIATLIRREREACCDDIVLSRTPDRHNYFEALVAFTQLTIDGGLGKPRSAYLLQFGGGRKTDLLWRVKRMLEKENKKLHLLEKTVLSFALFALVSFSLIKPRPTTNSKPEDRFAVTVANGKPATATNAKPATAISVQPIPAKPGTPVRPATNVPAAIISAPPVLPPPVVPVTDVPKLLKQLRTPQPIPTSLQSLLAPSRVELDTTNSPVTLLKPVLLPVDAGNKPAPTPENPVIWSPVPDINILHIALDLIKLHLLPDLNNYGFYLDNSTFTVNGVPVPEHIAQQFRKKYVLSPDYNFEYSQRWSPGSSGSHCIVHTPNHSANLTSEY